MAKLNCFAAADSLRCAQFPHYNGHLLLGTLQRCQRADTRALQISRECLPSFGSWRLNSGPPHLDETIPFPSVPALLLYKCGVTYVDLLFIHFFGDAPCCLPPQALKDAVVPVDHKSHTCVFPKCLGLCHKKI